MGQQPVFRSIMFYFEMAKDYAESSINVFILFKLYYSFYELKNEPYLFPNVKCGYISSPLHKFVPNGNCLYISCPLQKHPYAENGHGGRPPLRCLFF